MDTDTHDPHLADRAARFGARVVDNVLFFVPIVAPGIVLILAGPALEEDGAIDAMTGVVCLLASFLPILVLAQLWLLTTRGQTIGKRLLGLRIVDAAAAPPGFLRGVLLRESARYGLGAFPFLGIVGALADAGAVFANDRRALHDRLAGTWVVAAGTTDGPRLSEVADPGSGPSVAATVAILAFLGVGFLSAIALNAASAIPNFITMQHKAKRSEVPTSIREILAAEQRWRDDHGAWLPIGDADAALAAVPGAQPRPWPGGAGWEALGWAPDGAMCGVYWVEVAGDHVTVRGACDVDGDGELAVYEATPTAPEPVQLTEPLVY